MAGTACLGLQGLADAVRHRPPGEVAPLLGYRPGPDRAVALAPASRGDRNKAFERDARVLMAIMGVH